MRTRWLLLVCLVSSSVTTVARGQSYAEKGAVLGGVTGALAGAGIGNHNDETAAGALIGGAVGLVTGAAAGHSLDNKAERQWAIRQQYQQQQMQVLAQAVSTQDVVNMTQNGVSDDVIINHIRKHGVQRSLDVHDVIALHRQGVRESVISAMQQAPVGGPPAPVPTVVRPPVVVGEQYYVAPAWRYYPPPPPRYYYGPPHHHRPGVSWGITVRH